MKHYLIYCNGSGTVSDVGWVTIGFGTSPDKTQARRFEINRAHILCQNFNAQLKGGHIIHEEDDERI